MARELMEQLEEIMSKLQKQLEGTDWRKVRRDEISISATIQRSNEPIAPGLVKALEEQNLHYRIFSYEKDKIMVWQLTAFVPKKFWRNLPVMS